MNGHIVELKDCTFEGHLTADNCPTVEQELENVKKLKKENEQNNMKEKEDKEDKEDKGK